MDTIMAYVKELGDRGVLDCVDIDGADSTTSPARVLEGSEESSMKRQNTGSRSTARSNVSEDGPIIENHEERRVSPEDRIRCPHHAELDIRGKISKTLEARSSLS